MVTLTVHDVAGCPTVLVDGWIGDLYARVRRGSGPGTVSVCFGSATEGAPVQGGRLEISALGTP